MRNTLAVTVFWVFAIVLLASVSSADVPRVINYQGKLTDSSGVPVADSTYQIVFTLYDSPEGGSGMWYSGIQDILVANGHFTYQLGSTNSFPDTAFADTSRWLGIRVIGNDEIEPRTKLTSVPFASHALNADTASHVVTTDTIYVGHVRIEPTTRYYSIPPSAFQGQTIPYISYARLYRDTSSANPYHTMSVQAPGGYPTAFAPIHLPHGAVITQVTVYGTGFSADWDNEIAVERNSLADEYGLETLGSILVRATGESPTVISLTTFTDPVIDNVGYTYTLMVTEHTASPESFDLIGASIEYTIESPLP